MTQWHLRKIHIERWVDLTLTTRNMLRQMKCDLYFDLYNILVIKFRNKNPLMTDHTRREPNILIRLTNSYKRITMTKKIPAGQYYFSVHQNIYFYF